MHTGLPNDDYRCFIYRQYKYQLDSVEGAHGKAEKAINEIHKVMVEENLLKTGLNFK